MRLGTCLPQDQHGVTDGRLAPERPLAALAAAGIRGCLTNFVADEAEWAATTSRLGMALARTGVTLLEYNAPFFIQTDTRDACVPQAEGIVRLLELAESIGCRNVVTCVDGPAGLNPHPEARGARARDVLRETCERVAERASRRNLRGRLCLELVYTTVLWSPQVMAEFLAEVDSPHVQGHMDLVNTLHFDVLFDHAAHCRAAFGVLRGCFHSAHLKDVRAQRSYLPALEECFLGAGVLDLRTYLACLGALAADFPVLIEHLTRMDDIVRSHAHVAAVARELMIPVWA